MSCCGGPPQNNANNNANSAQINLVNNNNNNNNNNANSLNNPNKKVESFQGKVVLLGDSGVGKSKLVIRFTQDTFSEESECTVGGAFVTADIHLPEKKSVKLFIWDTAGQVLLLFSLLSHFFSVFFNFISQN